MECSPQRALQLYPMNHPGKQFQQQPNTFTHPPQSNQLASPRNEMSPMAPNATVPVPGLTGSPQPLPHYSSPMSSQTSQTGASGPNTTPLLSNRQAPSSAPTKMSQPNKRRRASTAVNMTTKDEDEETIGNPPPPKHPKQSPRIGIGGRGGGPGGPPGKRMRGDS